MTPDWLRVDMSVVQTAGLDAALVLSLIQFRSHATGSWEAKQGDIAASTHLSEYRVKAALTALREAGMVNAHRADRFHSILTWTPVSAGHTVNASDDFSGSSVTLPPERADSAVSSLEEVEEVPPTPTDALFDAPAPAPVRALRAVPSEADLDAEFAGFWNAYPRKTDRKAARIRYGKVRKTATVEQIAGALRRDLPDLIETKERDIKFVPLGASWLNKERWLDGPQEAPAPVPLTTAELHGTPSPERLAEHEAWLAANPPRRTIFQ